LMAITSLALAECKVECGKKEFEEDGYCYEVRKAPDKTYMAVITGYIGVGGDLVECRDKLLYVNQKRINHDFGVYTDPRIIPGNIRPRDNFGPIRVPENSLFVMGDNRDESFDSRFWGFVDLKAVNGKAFIVYWSWDKQNFGVRWNRLGLILK
jgi:signal peptidase I